MAIAAFNQAFIYPMMKWHVELGFLLKVAGVAKFGLSLDEQKLRFLGMVRGMAGDTTHVTPGVLRIDGIHVLVAARMARQAPRVNFLGGVFLENENLGLVSAASNVVCARTVASFAALVRRTTLGIERGLPVGSFLPIIIDIFMTSLASVRTDIVGSVGGCV